MKVVDVREAKATLVELVEQAEHGEEILIARGGQPVARIVALRAGRRRVLGHWRGRVRMSDDFDAPLSAPDQALWEGDAE